MKLLSSLISYALLFWMLFALFLTSCLYQPSDWFEEVEGEWNEKAVATCKEFCSRIPPNWDNDLFGNWDEICEPDFYMRLDYNHDEKFDEVPSFQNNTETAYVSMKDFLGLVDSVKKIENTLDLLTVIVNSLKSIRKIQQESNVREEKVVDAHLLERTNDPNFSKVLEIIHILEEFHAQ
jgi:hypothetical protein